MGVRGYALVREMKEWPSIEEMGRPDRAEAQSHSTKYARHSRRLTHATGKELKNDVFENLIVFQPCLHCRVNGDAIST
jgi:hypothetical protein